VYRLKELEQQFAMEKAASERQFEKQRQVGTTSLIGHVTLRDSTPVT